MTLKEKFGCGFVVIMAEKQDKMNMVNQKDALEPAVSSAIAAANHSWCTSSYARRSYKQYDWHWREQLASVYPELLAAGLALDEANHDVYEFGVYYGGSLERLRRETFHEARIFGFDAFSGFPPEEPNQTRISRWEEGCAPPTATNPRHPSALLALT